MTNTITTRNGEKIGTTEIFDWKEVSGENGNCLILELFDGRFVKTDMGLKEFNKVYSDWGKTI